MAVGKSINRVDAIAKVTGRARYTDDYFRPGMLIAKYFRSTIAHGKVLEIDTEKAEAIRGVEAVFTFKDVPKRKFATAGHPYTFDQVHKDVEDRLLLTQTVRFIGDEIAIVVAENELLADQALGLIDVKYSEYEPLVTPEKVLTKGVREIHSGSKNKVGEHQFECGGSLKKAFSNSDVILEEEFHTPMVQHCQLENHVAFAHMDDLDQIVIYSSTQIPHIVRRIVGEALEIPLSRVRVIKPYIGGGFGNKQDVILEPMVAFLTSRLNGRPIKINLSREECMLCTRNRHPFYFKVKTGVSKSGIIMARDLDAISVTGAYASHGHAIAGAAGSKSCVIYPRMAMKFHARTIYANIPVAGAMRAYGSPQINFALECSVDDAARKIKMDAVEFRLKNVARQGDLNPLSGLPIKSCGISECLRKGKKLIKWDEKKKKRLSTQKGPIRKGLGVACFSYSSGTYPVCVEIAGARIILNQDGSVHIQAGATEIGQGSDTIIAQMAAETIGMDVSQVHVVSVQDTDVTPFDTGAYASRQAYVISNALYRAATEIREKIISYATVLTGIPEDKLEIINGNLVRIDRPQKKLMSFKDLALDAYYNKDRGGQITADVSYKTTTNAPSFGCTFVDITVDIPLCQIQINEIYNIHDSGVILNPSLAKGQVEGGMAMGIGAAMSEAFLIDEDTGYVYNNNLLDYKVPTFMDTPDMGCEFEETFETTSGYGNKSLGEPPIITPPPAIRNAILDATDVKINKLPLSPHVLFKYFKKSGLL